MKDRWAAEEDTPPIEARLVHMAYYGEQWSILREHGISPRDEFLLYAITQHFVETGVGVQRAGLHRFTSLGRTVIENSLKRLIGYGGVVEDGRKLLYPSSKFLRGSKTSAAATRSFVSHAAEVSRIVEDKRRNNAAHQTRAARLRERLEALRDIENPPSSS